MTTPTIAKEIVYDRETKDYAAYVTIDDQREYIGSRRTQGECDKLCDDYAYAYNYYTDNHTPEVAAAIAVENREWWDNSPTQEELEEEDTAKEAPEKCTTCGGDGCPYCDPELATPPPYASPGGA